MRCSSCGNDNPDGLKFCNQCGAPFKLRCSKCSFDNALGARFCGECGAPLDSGGPAGPATEAPADSVGGSQNRHHSPSSERRHLTVLFCDLVGSTELAARLDPEEWQATVATYHRTAAAAIERFGGRVAKYLGDGVMAYFGHPEAHDNDAERAARAGLAILEAISYLNQQSGTGASLSVSAQLSVRVGIDSGVVVVGAGAGKEIDIFGETPNIAARVQAVAAPDSVLISAATHRLITGLFVVEDCGAKSLRGVERPIQLYRVIQPAGVRGRLAAAAASHGLTPFVGREDEIGMLMNRWQRVLDGEGQVVQVVGEAGIGKSRLVSQFHQQIAGSPHTWVEAAAAPFYQNTPFFPIAELLRQLAWEQIFDRFSDYLHEVQRKSDEQSSKPQTAPQPSDNRTTPTPFPSANSAPGLTGSAGASPGARFPASKNGEGEREDSPSPLSDMREGQGGAGDSRLTGLQSGLVRAGLKPAEAIPLIAPLLNLPLAAENTLSSLSPEQQRRRLLATLIEWLLGAGRAQPLVIVIEDLHWADPSTLELIQLLLEQGSTARILLLSTTRPEFRSEWPRRAHHTQITLNRLNGRDVREMIAQMAARDVIANEALETVVERTSGVPLFVEELTRAVLESGDAKPIAREIPVTLHDSLMARLDRLGSAKEVLQIGSVIGGEFTYQLLHAVHSASDEDLQLQLRRLTDADLLHVRGLAPEATYQFKHALIRDAAYEALLRSRRKELHQLVAHTIDEKFPDIKDVHPEVLARHWTEAGKIEAAIAEWTRAGKAAEARNAFLEALESFQRAVSLMDLLPESPECEDNELELRRSLVRMLWITKGYSARETVEATQTAAHRAEKGGKLLQFVSFMFSKGMAADTSPDNNALADQLLEIARREGSNISLAFAHALQIVVCYFRGNLAGVESHFVAGRNFFSDPAFLQFPGLTVSVLGAASINAWMLGQVSLARKRDAEMTAATNQSNPYEDAISGMYGALLRCFMREYEQAQAFAGQALDISEKHRFPWLAGLCRSFLGEARTQLGHMEEGIELLRQGIDDLLSLKAGMGLSNILAYFAATQGNEGSLRAAFETIEKAINCDELVYRPEIFRVRGDLRLRQGQTRLAEADFRQSISFARTMDAKAWQLRSTMSLSRLLDDQGRRDEARAMLGEIYKKFNEGFDTPDLKDAKALLDTLSS